jgi:hypothetical protein
MGNRVAIGTDTEIDRWYIGSFSSASYFITVEFDSNRKETMQVLVIARAQAANLSIFGRVSLPKLINLSAAVNDSWVSIIVNPISDVYKGAKISFTATYGQTMSQLIAPTAVAAVVPGSGCTLDISVTGNLYTITGVNQGGSGYTVGNYLKVSGTYLGGVTPTNDVYVVVNSVNFGVVLSVQYVTGTGTGTGVFTNLPTTDGTSGPGIATNTTVTLTTAQTLENKTLLFVAQNNNLDAPEYDVILNTFYRYSDSLLYVKVKDLDLAGGNVYQTDNLRKLAIEIRVYP